MRISLTLMMCALTLAAALSACGGNSTSGDSPRDTSAPNSGGNASDDENNVSAAVSTTLPSTFEIVATDPHYIIATPDWHAEGYGCGFALNENGSKDYAIVVACGYEAAEVSLKDAFSALYNDTFSGILMQNYRAKYAEFTPAAIETTLADGSSALLFEDVQPANDYGTELNCPVYGYGFTHDGVPFIVAYIVMNETAADDAKLAEMKSYVDEMVNTVRTAG